MQFHEFQFSREARARFGWIIVCYHVQSTDRWTVTVPWNGIWNGEIKIDLDRI